MNNQYNPWTPQPLLAWVYSHLASRNSTHIFLLAEEFRTLHLMRTSMPLPKTWLQVRIYNHLQRRLSAKMEDILQLMRVNVLAQGWIAFAEEQHEPIQAS